MQYYFIVNPVAGKIDQSQVIVPDILAAAQRAGIAKDKCTVITTKYKGHAQALAAEIAAKGEECMLFSVGGDGTFHEVINGAYLFKNVAVGCIPHGSGNDFLRTFGHRDAFLNLDAQFDGQAVDIDLMQTDNGVSAAICSIGLDAKVACGIPKFRRIPFCGGSVAYKLSILQCLCGKLGQKVCITLDDKVLHKDCLMIAVCNGKCYGGGFYAAPEASVTDGFLDVMIVKKIGLLQIAKVISLYQKGKHMKNGAIIPALSDVISFSRAKEIFISPEINAEMVALNEDGECKLANCLHVKMLAGAGRIILPKGVVL